jgi:hypothetical protein
MNIDRRQAAESLAIRLMSIAATAVITATRAAI